MFTLIAQAAALICHLNARCRGFVVPRLFPNNSTFRHCEFVRFLQKRPKGSLSEISECIENPDEWIDALVAIGVEQGYLLHHSDCDLPMPDHLAAFDGRDWFIGVFHSGRWRYWQPFWKLGDRTNVNGRVWRTQYEESHYLPDMARSESNIAEACARLLNGLREIEDFADRYHMNSFCKRFRKARDSLGMETEKLSVEHYFTDLAPLGSLELPALRLISSCEDAWVFDGWDSWPDRSFTGDVDQRYRLVTNRLFESICRAICVAVNESAKR